MNYQCGRCKQVKPMENFGQKSDGDFYKLCIECRNDEKEKYIGTKNCFLDDFPNLENEWFYEKNTELDLLPENFSRGSGKKVWWKCVENSNHVWEATIGSRTIRNKGCPFCCGKKLCEDGSNTLYAICGDILRQEWIEEKNGDMKLYSPNSTKKVWWKCCINPEHIWEKAVRSRTGKAKTGCPICSKTKLPYELISDELKAEWNIEKNGDMKELINVSRKVWWKCTKNSIHEWLQSLSNRGERDCPFCSGKRIAADNSNSLFANCSELLKQEWIEEKNGNMKLYSPNSTKKVWWKCVKKGHEWQAQISERVRGQNCSYCANKKVCEDGSNSLFHTASRSVKELWDEEKNGSMKKYAPSSTKIVSWKCEKGHEWEQNIHIQNKRNECSYCNGRRLCEDGSNSLWAYSTEKLKREWNEERNGSMKKYSYGSAQKVWWICEKDNNHEWEAMIRNRSNGCGCPICNQSTLEKELEECCNNLDLESKEQTKYKNCKSIQQLPYDRTIWYKHKEIRVEAQGWGHFHSNFYFHVNNQSFITRINNDNIKSLAAFKASHSFLSISYLCVENIEQIIKDYLEAINEYDILFRYYITPYTYLQYSKKGTIEIFDTEISFDPTDEILLIYRTFLHNINSLQNPIEVTEEDFTECCGKMYFNDIINEHRNIEDHE